MKKYFSLLVAFFVFSAISYGQEEQKIGQTDPNFSGVDGIVKKEHIINKKGIPYAHVREADVLWSKSIWRIIDLREKINLPLYYPTKNIDGRRSLINVILDAIGSGELTAYDPNQNDEFALRMEYKDVKSAMGAQSDTIDTRNPETGLYEQRVVHSDMRSDEVKKFLLKEVWFFDKKYTRMDVRIIGLCPIREAANDEGTRIDQKLMFWVYFPEVRPFLAKNEVYNTKNDSQRDSFDDLFAKRRFGSYVFRDANVYNNRAIVGFNAGMETTLEAERIKDVLFTKEHDMWEF